nr:MAG TPA_asm: hypothetical protein [Caudoviricetes sp.]
MKAINSYEHYEVKSVEYNGGLIVNYEVIPAGASAETCIVSRTDKPHEDFIKLWLEVHKVATKMLEFPLENAEGTSMRLQVVKIKFLKSSKYGDGIQLVVQLWGLLYSLLPLRITTHKYYQMGVDRNHDAQGTYFETQKLSSQEMALFDDIEKEAFAYAYYGKREQPTLDEAAEAETHGGKFKDERAEII